MAKKKKSPFVKGWKINDYWFYTEFDSNDSSIYLMDKEIKTEEEANRRANICLTSGIDNGHCEQLKKGEVLAILKDGMKEIEGAYCGECICPLVAALRSKDYKCPKNKF